jgi:histone demethylase JARID1
VEEAPVFRPSPEEFADAMAYIEKIRPVGERFGEPRRARAAPVPPPQRAAAW